MTKWTRWHNIKIWQRWFLFSLSIVIIVASALFLLLFLFPATTSLLPSFLMRQDVTWNAMQSRGVWRVGLDPSFPPFEHLDENGMAVGIDVDLAEEIASLWDMEVEIVAIGFDSLLDALKAGKIDSIVSAMPYDPHLTKDFRYSQSYFEAGLRWVMHDQASWIDENDFVLASNGQSTSHEDHTEETLSIANQKLHNRRVAVEWGSVGDMVGRRLQRAEPSLELIQFETPQETIDALIAGNNHVDGDKRIDALLIDNITLYQAQAAGALVHAVGPALESNPYVIVMPYNAPILVENLSQALDTILMDGTLEKIQAHWFEEHGLGNN
ncbi:MAG: ABC transporter substrate-binding protein [Chloroflexota bacterium]